MKSLIYLFTIFAVLFVSTSCSHFRFLGKKGGASSGRPTEHRVSVAEWEAEKFAEWCEETENLICSAEYNYPYADED